jgi:choline monooxygenase
MEDTEDFDKADFGLVSVRVETWGPFVFVNLDASARPLAEMMGAIPGEVAAAGYDVDNMRPVERRDYVIECNWKVYVDNYLEGYHLRSRTRGFSRSSTTTATASRNSATTPNSTRRSGS